MADKKYLDGGGLAHLWDKIKSYLTTWKTSNFGTGTYSNSGTFSNRGRFTSSAKLIQFISGSYVDFQSEAEFRMNANSYLSIAQNTYMKIMTRYYVFLTSTHSCSFQRMAVDMMCFIVMKTPSTGGYLNFSSQVGNFACTYTCICGSSVKTGSFTKTGSKSITGLPTNTPALVIMSITDADNTADGN